MGYTLEQLVDVIGEIARTRFPDLGFLDPSGVLTISTPVDDVVGVRVELPDVGFLHLASVLVDSDVEGLAASTSVTSSSTWKGYGEHLSNKFVLDPDFRGAAFHTKKEQGPWLDLRFESPISLKSIVIRNRDNQTALRARGLQVRVLTSAGLRMQVYNGQEREAQFLRAVECVFGGVDDVRGADVRSMSTAADLAHILAKIHLRQYGPALSRDLRHMRLSPENASRFRDLVSKKVLRKRELEWTSHSVKRSFRFWGDDEKRAYVGYAVQLVEDLSDLTENVCLGFGSVLAVVRDQDLIPHDDDLDIIVAFEPHEAPKINDALLLIEDHLRRRGYSVTSRNRAHRLVSKPPHRKVDVFAGIFEEDAISWYPGQRGSLTRDMVFPAVKRPLLGHDCPVPRRPEAYLKQVYGPGWKTPDPHFRHTWQPSGYADILR